MTWSRPQKVIIVALAYAVVFVIGIGVGIALRRPSIALRRDLPIEYSYFEVQMALATGSPEQTLLLVDRILDWYNHNQLVWPDERPRALMQKSVMLTVRSRALFALGRDGEAHAAALSASQACIQAGRKYCDSKELTEFSRRSLRAAWERSD